MEKLASYKKNSAQPGNGKVAIVTGGGRGIGEAIALRFASEGLQVILAARSAADLQNVVCRAESAGGSAIAVVADVSNAYQVAKLVDSAIDEFGRIDVLVNAAGVQGPIGLAWELDRREWLESIHINLFGTFLMCHAVLPHMIRQQSGSIILFSGGGAAGPRSRFSAYAVAKAAVVRLTETLAEEVKQFNIRVNAIAPGAVDTKLQDEVLAAGDKAGAAFEQVRRMRQTGEGATPRELPAALISFLASDDSAPLTGRLISAPHDGWQTWTREQVTELESQRWFTLRRLDEFTLKPMLELRSSP